MQVLEDVLGGFAALSAPMTASIRNRSGHVGRHTVAPVLPQAVITSLVLSPLEQAGMKIQDIDNTRPSCKTPTYQAGRRRDVPLANSR